MMGHSSSDNASCPFPFNFDATTFKVGDIVSYRVASLGDFPFVGKLIEVHDDYVVLEQDGSPGEVYKATRESRPIVRDPVQG